MGDPIECEHVEPGTGDAYQRTTTGLAMYRRDTNIPMFTNGQEHWALTASGMAHWSGWHGSASPPGVDAAQQGSEVQLPAAPTGTYPSVEAVTVVDILNEDGLHIVVRRGSTRYLIETDGGCVADSRPVGEEVFVLSPARVAGPESRLILVPGRHECLIMAAQQLE